MQREEGVLSTSKLDQDTSSNGLSSNAPLVRALFYSVTCSLSIFVLLIISQCIKTASQTTHAEHIVIFLFIACIVCSACSLGTNLIHKRIARLSILILSIIIVICMVATFVYSSALNVLFSAVSFILLSVLWLCVLPTIDNHQEVFFEPLPFLSATIIIVASDFLALPLVEIVSILLSCYCTLFFVYLFSSSNQYACTITRQESRENLFEDITPSRRFISIFSWGLSTGIMLFLALTIMPKLSSVSFSMGASYVIAGWIAALLSHIQSANVAIPKMSGAFIILSFVLLYTSNDALLIGGILFGFSFILSLAFSLVDALRKRTEICQISGLWLFGKQLGFYFLGVLVAYALSLSLYTTVPDLYLNILIPFGVIIVAMGQIVISDSYFPKLPEESLEKNMASPLTNENENLNERPSKDVHHTSTGASPANTDMALHAIARTYNLSPRQEEVYALLIKGRNIRYISQTLFVSESTIKTHTHNIYQKTGVSSQQELISQFDTAAGELSHSITKG